MAYWLLKSEPGAYSFNDMQKDGTTYWDGVRNYQAANNMRAMKEGDLALFYHSVNEKAVQGVVEVTKEAYPDPSDEKGRFCMVDVTFKEELPHKVTLAEIKAEHRLEHIALIKQSRLSVVPLTEDDFNLIVQMAKS